MAYIAPYPVRDHWALIGPVGLNLTIVTHYLPIGGKLHGAPSERIECGGLILLLATHSETLYAC